MAVPSVTIEGSSRSSDIPTGLSDGGHRGWLFVGAALLGVVALGVWGLTADRGTPATVGTAISHDGGSVMAIGAWTIDDPMLAMMGGGGDEENADQFAQAGMPMAPMSQMMSDAVPEGMKRVAVELDLVAGDTVMRFPGSGMTLDVDGKVYRPYSTLLADEQLQPNSQLTAVVTFEVPIEVEAATFHLGPDAKPIDVDVSMGPDGQEPATHDHDE
ncbi:hypothetical protein NHL50_14610 [Acidimicrobiia bacterium EGI L10123]|uniref:hypothetical protein n=1 Tax=Salinilacustrithrix flava TaxID=2957203 RepID=UPI003D7C2036|nr:hypothetical protein [Acidimicrobiia bacterium EGI L10123]